MQLLQQVGTSSTRRNFVLPPPLIVATHKTTQWEKPKIPKTKAKNPPVVSSGRNLPIVGPAGEAAKGSRGGGDQLPPPLPKRSLPPLVEQGRALPPLARRSQRPEQPGARLPPLLRFFLMSRSLQVR